jgi:hypothetical protein
VLLLLWEAAAKKSERLFFIMDWPFSQSVFVRPSASSAIWKERKSEREKNAGVAPASDLEEL